MPARQQHVIRRGNLEPIVVDRCPRKLIREVGHYFNVYNWANKGLLQYQYQPDEFLAKHAEALDMIDYEFDEKNRIQMEGRDGKSG